MVTIYYEATRLASKSGLIAAVRLLLEDGANPTIQIDLEDNSKRSALICADFAPTHQEEIKDLLIEHGATEPCFFSFARWEEKSCDIF